MGGDTSFTYAYENLEKIEFSVFDPSIIKLSILSAHSVEIL